MSDNALTTFVAQTRAVFGPLSTDMVAAVRAHLEQLSRASSSEAWLRALYAELPAARELYRDANHGFMLLAHSEPAGLYRPPHDHGRGWVIYALARGELEVGTYARLQDADDADGQVRLVKREVSALRAGDARVYLPGDIHDTRCVSGPALLFRFTERDLKKEDQEAHRVTRYVARDGGWTVAPA